ncbi:cytochrome c oxidase subunit II [Sandarakinorhabdus sp. AAP62]|uniref:cytochrome c oxidase subunit II n=1 Tax=Sandarakinorhabdus sp. AAP62 TaxID=1248916 RepID=UPI0002FFCD04|nr:cytochrome c oxidase subunit II [Sandarakinorhabdus sp. AAP62]
MILSAGAMGASVRSFAQEAVAAAPVPPVATTEVPAAVPALTAPSADYGVPRGGWDLQLPATDIAVEAHNMINWVLNPVMAGVSIFVLALLAWTLFRYRAAANPVPSKNSHNTVIEVIWTVVPALILVVIAFPSFRLLANQYDPPKADLTIKAIGHQWYWEYEYPDQGGFTFDAVMLTNEEAEKRGTPKLLDTDNRVVVPVGATVKILTTAADVIHSFAIPAFYVKMDAVPGRINETWFKTDRPGVYFGQCSELCGTKHAYMPIAIEVLPKAQFDAWVAAKQKENGIEAPKAAEAAPATAPAADAAAPVADAAAAAPAAQ